MEQQLKRMLKVIHIAENLKKEMRHSWLSNGRQESVAEHTWRMSLMALLLIPYLQKEIKVEKLLKMIIIHDLVEAEASDIPAFETMNNAQLQKQKEENEKKAIINLRNMLSDEVGDEFYHLWHEFEKKETYEAKVANAIDKLEVQIQHNEADISTWLEIEHEMSFLIGKHTNFEPVLDELKEMIEIEAEKKLLKAGVDIHPLKENAK